MQKEWEPSIIARTFFCVCTEWNGMNAYDMGTGQYLWIPILWYILKMLTCNEPIFGISVGLFYMNVPAFLEKEPTTHHWKRGIWQGDRSCLWRPLCQLGQSLGAMALSTSLEMENPHMKPLFFDIFRIPSNQHPQSCQFFAGRIWKVSFSFPTWQGLCLRAW